MTFIDPNNADPGVWADSAYRSEEAEKVLQDAGYESHICEKCQRNRPLTDEQRRTTAGDPRSVPVSSTSSASRRTAWVGNSSAPLA